LLSLDRNIADSAVRLGATAAGILKRGSAMRRTIYELLVLLTFLFTSAFVWAADYPVRPVSVLVAFPPGGASDVLARIVTRKLEDVLGQPFIIENRPGAGGNIAAEVVARAAPDGYTLLNGNNAILATNAALYKKINFDAVADFAPVGLIGSQANILVVNPALPVHSMAELIALARANPGKQLCLIRAWLGGASRRRAVQGGGEDRYRPHSVQGCGPRVAGCDRRACADDVCHRFVRGLTHPGGPAAATCGYDAQANLCSAGHSDH
jgi:hypothetical protein